MKKLLLGLATSLLLVVQGHAEEVWQTLPEPPAMPEPVESGMAPVNDIEMYYAVYGEGEPVLLIHGGLGDADVWGFQVPALAEDHRVIVADSRGHGRSTRSDQPFGYELMADDYLALLDHLGIEQTALVGWSDGGIIGLDIAIRHPPPTSSARARTMPACRRRPTSSTRSSSRSRRCGRASRTTPRISCVRSRCAP